MSDARETAGYPRTYENYNSKLKHKLPLRVTFETPKRMEQAKFADGSLGCCYYESEMHTFYGWSLVKAPFDLSTLDTAGVFHDSQQPAPVETFVPTWGPEWEYVANHGTVFTFLLDDKSEVAPIKLTCQFGDVWFSRDGAAAFGASWVIVSQRPRTPAPETPATSQPADVPQWCVDAAMEAYDLWGDFFSSTRIPDVATIIARHARANEAGEVERLKGELEREEREHGNTIDHRDQHENAINDICNALGLDEEGCKWSSHSYPPQNAIDRIERLFSELEEARKEAEQNGHFEMRQVEEREAIKKAVGFEETGPTLPEWCRRLTSELTTLRERLAGAEGRIAAVREIVEQVKLSALKQADYEYAATMLNLRDCLDHGNAIDLDRLATLLPSAGRFVSIRAREKQIDELHERVKFFDEELNDTTALRADLARAKDALIHIGSFFGCSAHLPWFSDDACDEVSAIIDAYGGEKRYDPALYETYCARVIADIVTGALSASAGGDNHIAEAGKMVAELHRQSLEAYTRGDLNTADRLAALIGDELPSKFEKEDLKAQHEEGGE